MINAWQWEKSKVIAFPASKSWLNFRVQGQFEIKILKVWLMNTTYFICILKKNWTWACDHLKGSNLSADTLKNTRTQWVDTWARDRPGDTGQQTHYFDSCQLIKTWMYNIRLQAPKLARKCEIKHWYACADGRMVGWSVYGHVIE